MINNKNNKELFDPYDPIWDEYSKKFIEMKKKGDELLKEFHESVNRILEYGTIDDVPEDKSFLVDDYIEKDEALKKNIEERKVVLQEFADFRDSVTGGIPATNILS